MGNCVTSSRFLWFFCICHVIVSVYLVLLPHFENHIDYVNRFYLGLYAKYVYIALKNININLCLELNR